VAIILALEKLFDDVVTRFAAEGNVTLAMANTFGWKEPWTQLVPTQRIQWTPGDEQGNTGDVGAAKWPGDNPRSIGTMFELFTVRITASDVALAADIQNDRKQWKAARLLFDEWYRAIYLASFGTFSIKRSRWLTERREGRYGVTIIVVATIEAKLPDRESGTPAPIDTAADITVLTLDVTDPTVRVEPDPP
jgi:hypothetical protein